MALVALLAAGHSRLRVLPLPAMPMPAGLTETQTAAVCAPAEPHTLLEIVAPPGAGKSHTLIHRIARLALRVPPEQLLVLSMTTRTAAELRARLAALLGEAAAARVAVHTFHSFCLEVVQRHRGPVSVVLEAGWRTLVAMAHTRAVTAHTVQRIVSDGLVDVETALQQHGVALEVVARLVNTVRDSNTTTFPRLVEEAAAIMAHNPAIAALYEVVVVDECQDMYPDLLTVVAAVGALAHVTVAGDPFQSIYSFLGSTPDTAVPGILPHHTHSTITLSKLFRSSAEIVAAALAVVGRQQETATPQQGGPLPVYHCSDGTSHVAFLQDEILLLAEHGTAFLEMAVLAPTNREVNQLGAALHRVGIPVEATAPDAAHQFGDFVRVLADPSDNFAVLSAVRCLPGIGPAALVQLQQRGGLVLDHLVGFGSPLQQKSLAGFHRTVTESVAALHTETLLAVPGMVLSAVCDYAEQCGVAKLVGTHPSPFVQHLVMQSLETLHSQLHRAHQQGMTGGRTLARWQQTERLAEGHGGVKLSTIHGAKGMEFPATFVVHQRAVPHRNSEALRLLYVALSRPQRMLYLVGVSKRVPWGFVMR